MSTAAVIKYAYSSVNEELYGDIDYYMEKNEERCKIIEMLIEIVDSQAKEITELKTQQTKLVEKVLGTEKTVE